MAWKEGDTGYEVEWCCDLPTYPDDPNTIDTDNAKYVRRDFRTKEDAYAYAKKVFPKDKGGAVRITPFLLERLVDEHPFHIEHNCHVEYTADSDYYEGE